MKKLRNEHGQELRTKKIEHPNLTATEVETDPTRIPKFVHSRRITGGSPIYDDVGLCGVQGSEEFWERFISAQKELKALSKPGELFWITYTHDEDGSFVVVLGIERAN